MIKFTAEQQLACALIDYIEAKPDHICGLCRYLSGNGGNENEAHYGIPLMEGYSYTMIRIARERYLQQYGEESYVDYMEGPTKVRLAFAKDLLKLVEQGKLKFNVASGAWKTR